MRVIIVHNISIIGMNADICVDNYFNYTNVVQVYSQSSSAWYLSVDSHLDWSRSQSPQSLSRLEFMSWNHESLGAESAWREEFQ